MKSVGLLSSNLPSVIDRSNLLPSHEDNNTTLFIFKVCQTQSADLSVFVLFFLLSYFSLPPSASLDFSLISQPISMKFGMLIVLDETKRCLRFQVNRTRGGDRAWSQSLLCFIIGKTLYTVRRDKNFT